MMNLHNLLPFAAFTSIVGVILMPLSKIGGVYSWPCTTIAIAVSLFYIGCFIAEKIHGKASKKSLVGIGVVALAFLLQKYIADAIYYKRPLYDCYIAYWAIMRLSIHTLHWFLYYAAFVLMGIVANLSIQKPHENRFWKDLISGCSCFVLYMVLSTLPRVPEIYNHLTLSSITILRITALIPMLGTLVYVYRCVTSERASSWVNKWRNPTQILVSMCPGAIFLTIINFSPNALAILILPIIAYILSILYRFTLKLLKSLYMALFNKDFGWKEILIGKL